MPSAQRDARRRRPARRLRDRALRPPRPHPPRHRAPPRRPRRRHAPRAGRPPGPLPPHAPPRQRPRPAWRSTTTAPTPTSTSPPTSRAPWSSPGASPGRPARPLHRAPPSSPPAPPHSRIPLRVRVFSVSLSAAARPRRPLHERAPLRPRGRRRAPLVGAPGGAPRRAGPRRPHLRHRRPRPRLRASARRDGALTFEGDRALRYLDLARARGVAPAADRLRHLPRPPPRHRVDAPAFARALSPSRRRTTSPLLLLPYDEPGTRDEIDAALAAVRPFTDAGLLTMGFASRAPGRRPLRRPLRRHPAPSLNGHTPGRPRRPRPPRPPPLGLQQRPRPLRAWASTSGATCAPAPRGG